MRNVSVKFPGQDRNCCVPIALALLFKKPFLVVNHQLKRKPNKGVVGSIWKKYITNRQGAIVDIIKAFENEKNITVETFVKKYPQGRYALQVPSHLIAVIDGVIYDTKSENKRRVKFACKIKVI